MPSSGQTSLAELTCVRKPDRFVSSLNLLFRLGWVDGWSKLIIKLNSAQFELNLPVGAELGN